MSEKLEYLPHQPALYGPTTPRKSSSRPRKSSNQRSSETSLPFSLQTSPKKSSSTSNLFPSHSIELVHSPNQTSRNSTSNLSKKASSNNVNKDKGRSSVKGPQKQQGSARRPNSVHEVPHSSQTPSKKGKNPPTPQQKQSVNGDLYAGALFQNSPAASSLPIPVFLTGNKPQTQESHSMDSGHGFPSSSYPYPTQASSLNSLGQHMMTLEQRAMNSRHSVQSTVHQEYPVHSIKDDGMFSMDKEDGQDLKQKSRDLLSLLNSKTSPPSPPTVSATGPVASPENCLPLVHHYHHHHQHVCPPQGALLDQMGKDLKNILNIG